MAWPDRVWRPRDPNADDMGMVPFAGGTGTTTQRGIDAGLPEDWQDYDNTITRVSAWDVMENPLYEAAAGALDIDWEDLKERFNNDIGLEDDYDRPESTDNNTGEDDSYDWGITHSELEEDFNDMQGWLQETIGDAEDHAGYSGDGPDSSDYQNISGNIWTALGLDSPPEKPEVLSDDYFEYKDDPSNYDTPVSGHMTGAGYENPWIVAAQWVGQAEVMRGTGKGWTAGASPKASQHKADQ